MIGHMAIAIALSGFNDLGRSVTRPFFLFRWIIFSTDFPHLAEKNEEKLSIRNLNFFLQNALSNSILFRSSLICAGVSNVS